MHSAKYGKLLRVKPAAFMQEDGGLECSPSAKEQQCRDGSEP